MGQQHQQHQALCTCSSGLSHLTRVLLPELLCDPQFGQFFLSGDHLSAPTHWHLHDHHAVRSARHRQRLCRQNRTPHRMYLWPDIALSPSVLSQTSRATISEETFSITSSSFDLTDSTDYYISAYLRDFRVDMAQTQTQEIRVQSVSVSGQTVQVVLYSRHTYANSVQSITLTLLLIKKSAFTPSIVYYNS